MNYGTVLTCGRWPAKRRNVAKTTTKFLLPGAAERPRMTIYLVAFYRRGCGGCLVVQLSTDLRSPRGGSLGGGRCFVVDLDPVGG